MRLLSIYLGSWFPKTDLHLEELKKFLISKTVIEGLDEARAHAYHEALNPTDISLLVDDGAAILEATSGPFRFRYIEDGLLMLKKDVEGIGDDRADIKKFYLDILSPSLAYIFSTGAKGLEVIRTPGGEKTTFVTVEDAKEKDIETIFSTQDKTIETIETYNGFSVSSDETLAVVNFSKKIKHDERETIVEYLIFFAEVKRHLNKLLQTHRTIWDEAELMLSGRTVKNKELPIFNERLTASANIVANVESRIDQMRVNVIYRKNIIDQYTHCGKEFLPLFDNILQNMDYMKTLFIMTGRHLQNNITNLATIYQENEDRALNKLQVLFLTTVVTSFLTLVEIPDLRTLIKLGVFTIIATIIIYYLLNINLRRVRIKK